MGTISMTIDKIEHAVVYAYNHQVHITFFDTAEAAKRKVSEMLEKPQLWKIHFCEAVSATSNAICELRDRVQDTLNLLQIIQERTNNEKS